MSLYGLSGFQSEFLLDRNADPRNTVYYISSRVFRILVESEGLDLSELSALVSAELNLNARKHRFIILALDFLYLLGKIRCDSEGLIHVNQIHRNC